MALVWITPEYAVNTIHIKAISLGEVSRVVKGENTIKTVLFLRIHFMNMTAYDYTIEFENEDEDKRRDLIWKLQQAL